MASGPEYAVDEALRAGHGGSDFTRQQAGGGRSDQRVGPGGGADLTQNLPLQVEAFGQAFLDDIGIGDQCIQIIGIGDGD